MTSFVKPEWKREKLPDMLCPVCQTKMRLHGRTDYDSEKYVCKKCYEVKHDPHNDHYESGHNMVVRVPLTTITVSDRFRINMVYHPVNETSIIDRYCGEAIFTWERILTPEELRGLTRDRIMKMMLLK